MGTENQKTFNKSIYQLNQFQTIKFIKNMKAIIIILVAIFVIIYVFNFLDDVSHEGGIIGAVAGIVAVIGVGAGFYSLFFDHWKKPGDK